MRDLAKLEKTKGTLRIIAHINEKGKTRFTDIMNETGVPSHTAYAVLGQLIELKLIREGLSGGFPSKKCYKLTKKGKEIAEQIEAMRVVLSELGKKKEG